MGLFDFFKSKRLSLEWEYRSSNVLWRLLPAPGGLLFGEERDTERKEVSFFCIDVRRGSPLWRGTTFDEKWWIGLEAVHADVVFLHEYTTPDMPEHKKIIAVDAFTGNTRWVNSDLSFAFADGSFVYARKALYDNTSLYELDISDGRIVRQLDQENTPVSRIPQADMNDAIEFPGFTYPDQLSDKIRSILGSSGVNTHVISGIEYLVYGPYTVTTSYENISEASGQFSLRHTLRVFSDVHLRFMDIIAKQASVVVPGTFFRMGERIIYVKEKNSLRSLKFNRQE